MRLDVKADPATAVLLAVATAIIVLLGGQVLLGASAVGVAVDDYVHAARLDEWLRSGWYVPSFFLVDGSPDPLNGEATPFVYGAAFSVLAHLVNVVAGNEAIGDVSTEADAYAVRHLIGGLFGLITALCAGGAVWVLTRSRVAAVWGTAALLAIPAWTGYSMFSNKDVPVAAGFTLITFALVLALSWLAEPERRPRRRGLAIAALIAAGVYVGAGTRPAMWAPGVFSLALFACLAWVMLRSRAAWLRASAPPAIGFVVGMVVIAALSPRVASNPIEWLFKSVTESSGYGRDEVYTLTAGQFVGEFPPPWYLPVWLLASVPLLLAGVAAIGGATSVRELIRWRRWTGGGPRSVAFAGGSLLVLVQLALLPVGALVVGAASSHGLRQHIYMLPALAILAGIGAARLLERASPQPGGRRALGWAACALLCLALAIPAVEQSRLYPYNYVYVNPAAGIGGVEGRWETEYQFVSAREAFRRVPAATEPLCSGWLIAARGETKQPVLRACGPNLTPYADEVGAEATVGARPGRTWVIGRLRAAGYPPAYCRERDNVTRPLRGEELVMAYVLECRPPPSELPPEPP